MQELERVRADAREQKLLELQRIPIPASVAELERCAEEKRTKKGEHGEAKFASSRSRSME